MKASAERPEDKEVRKQKKIGKLLAGTHIVATECCVEYVVLLSL